MTTDIPPIGTGAFHLKDLKNDGKIIQGYADMLDALIHALDIAVTEMDHPDAPVIGCHLTEMLAHAQAIEQHAKALREWL